MEESIKEIISVYLGVDASSIHSGTLINRSAFGNSITLHRMYAKLAEGGVVIENYFDINTYGELLARTGSSNSVNPSVVAGPADEVLADRDGIGIDIERVAEMPESDDYREEVFYQLNFHPSEIAYCILQPAPRVSFAGLFAAKEAIVKADNIWRSQPFNRIVINHTETGKPLFGSMQISISHTADTAIAVAVKWPTPAETMLTTAPAGRGNSGNMLLASVAILLSILTLAIVLFRR